MIRPATPDDLDTIIGFVRELAEYEREPEAVTFDRDELRRNLFGEGGGRPFAECLIAEEGDGTPAGFALFFHNFSTWTGKPGVYLEDLYVRPEARGRGHGRALLAHLARLAVDRGCGRFEWSVLDWNEPAIGFYRSVGAVGMDEWTVQRLDGDALRKLAAEADPAK